MRDGLSLLAVDWRGDLLWYVGNIPTRNELLAVRVVDNRANLLDTSRLAEEAALDYYAYVRDAYLQRRRSLIYDGDAPSEPDPAKTSESGAETAARTETELPPSQIASRRDERAGTAADEELTPAKAFSASQAQPFAAGQEAGGAAASVYEPRIPDNNDALLVAIDAARIEFAHARPRP